MSRLEQFRGGFPLPHHAMPLAADTPDVSASIVNNKAVADQDLITFDTITTSGGWTVSVGGIFLLGQAPGGYYELKGAFTTTTNCQIKVTFNTDAYPWSYVLNLAANTTMPFSNSGFVTTGDTVGVEFQMLGGSTLTGTSNGAPTCWFQCSQVTK